MKGFTFCEIVETGSVKKFQLETTLKINMTKPIGVQTSFKFL